MSVKKRRDSERQINVDLPIDLADSLDAFCEQAKMKRKAVAELALRRFLNERRVSKEMR